MSPPLHLQEDEMIGIVDTNIPVKITSHSNKIAPVWRGREATLLRWVADDWYLVNCGGVELVLSIDEFTRTDRD